MKKPRKPKHWRHMVKIRVVIKRHKRKYWTLDRRWRHVIERVERRKQSKLPQRPDRMTDRLRLRAKQRDSALRSARMKAYHARQRAALAAE